MKKLIKLEREVNKLRADAVDFYMKHQLKGEKGLAFGAENMLVAYDNVLREIQKLKDS